MRFLYSDKLTLKQTENKCSQMLCIASFCLPEFMSKLSHQLTALRSEALGRELRSESGVPADGLCALMKRPGGGVRPPLLLPAQ